MPPPRVVILVEGATTHLIARPKDGLYTYLLLLLLVDAGRRFDGHLRHSLSAGVVVVQHGRFRG